MKYILIVMMALLVIGCGSGGDTNVDPNSTVVTSNITTPPVNVTTPPVTVHNDYNVTIVVPGASSSSSSQSSSSNSSSSASPCNAETSGGDCGTVVTEVSTCQNGECPTGCNETPTDECGLPTNYVGAGTSFNPF